MGASRDHPAYYIVALVTPQTTVAPVTRSPTPTIVTPDHMGCCRREAYHAVHSEPYGAERHEHFLHWASDDSQLVFDRDHLAVDIEGTQMGRIVNANPDRGNELYAL